MPRIARVVIPGMPHHAIQRASVVSLAERATAAAHRGLREEGLLSPIEMPWPVDDWSAYLRQEDEEEVAALRLRTRTGRPSGPVEFVRRLEKKLRRPLLPRKRGPKPRHTNRRTRPTKTPKKR
ncbi:MAG: hypothetical protein ACYS5V_02545 [Planctomycetota bacterium]|jgi:hypothetical protein